MNPGPSLIGPAASVLEAARVLVRTRDRVAILLDGDPGTGKTTLLDQLALELTGSKFAIEHVNGQSLLIELVRSWRERAGVGNLFSAWTVKRVDELDLASLSATNELLTYLDYPVAVPVLQATRWYWLARLWNGVITWSGASSHGGSFTQAEEDVPTPTIIANDPQVIYGAVADGERATANVSIAIGQGFTRGPDDNVGEVRPSIFITVNLSDYQPGEGEEDGISYYANLASNGAGPLAGAAIIDDVEVPLYHSAPTPPSPAASLDALVLTITDLWTP